MINEYQMVAALVCMDIDIICRTAERKPEMALEAIRKLKERKDKIVNDEEHRKMRYGATCSVFNIGRLTRKNLD